MFQNRDALSSLIHLRRFPYFQIQSFWHRSLSAPLGHHLCLRSAMTRQSPPLTWIVSCTSWQVKTHQVRICEIRRRNYRPN